MYMQVMLTGIRSGDETELSGDPTPTPAPEAEDSSEERNVSGQERASTGYPSSRAGITNLAGDDRVHLTSIFILL